MRDRTTSHLRAPLSRQHIVLTPRSGERRTATRRPRCTVNSSSATSRVAATYSWTKASLSSISRPSTRSRRSERMRRIELDPAAPPQALRDLERACQISRSNHHGRRAAHRQQPTSPRAAGWTWWQPSSRRTPLFARRDTAPARACRRRQGPRARRAACQSVYLRLARPRPSDRAGTSHLGACACGRLSIGVSRRDFLSSSAQERSDEPQQRPINSCVARWAERIPASSRRARVGTAAKQKTRGGGLVRAEHPGASRARSATRRRARSATPSFSPLSRRCHQAKTAVLKSYLTDGH